MLDMFTGAESVDGKIRTRAVIISDPLSANRETIFAAGLRILHKEFRENRLIPDILELEVLLAPELAPQGRLPTARVNLYRRQQSEGNRIRMFLNVFNWC